MYLHDRMDKTMEGRVGTAESVVSFGNAAAWFCKIKGETAQPVRVTSNFVNTHCDREIPKR